MPSALLEQPTALNSGLPPRRNSAPAPSPSTARSPRRILPAALALAAVVLGAFAWFTPPRSTHDVSPNFSFNSCSSSWGCTAHP